jgi:hypothetical protein
MSFLQTLDVLQTERKLQDGTLLEEFLDDSFNGVSGL